MNIGERVGDYEIVQILGAGGMGQVYKVRNVISNRIEAMKVLLPNLGADPGLAERFLREIQVQATLDHPNIARLHTAQMAGDQLVMILEYVEGSTIEKLLESGTLGVRETIGYIRQVLDALAYAHERGVVHRDIKPANIMRTHQGSVKLMDFGIARMQQDRRLTQTGSTVGSLFYMSPEQIKGAQPDPRSDLYSLGVTMYEMVTGRRPFEGTSDYSVMAAHLQQVPVAPIEVVPGVPPEVNDIILMAIAKDPEQRFQTAAAFRGALDAVGTGAGFTPAVAHTAVIPRVPPPVPQGSMQPPAPLAPPPAPLPPPPMYAAAPPPFSPPVAQRTSSKRGLYMTLGSIATVAVIVLAVFAAPRFLHTGAANLPQSVTDPAPTSTPPPQQNTAPVNPAPSEPEPAVNAPNPAQQAPAPQQPRPNSPVPSQQNPAPRSTPAAPVVPVQQPPVQQNPPPQQQAPTPAQQPAPAAQTPAQTPVVQPAPPIATPQQPPSNPPARQAPAASPELSDLRQDYNLISVRAAAAKSGLRSIEQQQRRQGLNLRGDITEAEARMDYMLKESMDSIRAGDASTGRRNLQMAERALESLEKFLGR